MDKRMRVAMAERERLDMAVQIVATRLPEAEKRNAVFRAFDEVEHSCYMVSIESKDKVQRQTVSYREVSQALHLEGLATHPELLIDELRRAGAVPLAEGASSYMSSVLRLAVRLMPTAERAEWLEEQRGYLADLPTRQARWAWLVAQLVAMPRYAYTVRTGREKESA
ncbi:hypothetical protein [Streptomyces turgidiscabies]|uniref:Uncharacterized protein n=1 Tax=Streptomyces turgidiscabies TaxID=85558 RepID=A0ABU0RST5_9ACTN|nr:hypothetical protein [Streptomyces turgidiscabies]MDQ0935062.1 hypothetical protein [Streptomyces turgidiscabies]